MTLRSTRTNIAGIPMGQSTVQAIHIWSPANCKKSGIPLRNLRSRGSSLGAADLAVCFVAGVLDLDESHLSPIGGFGCFDDYEGCDVLAHSLGSDLCCWPTWSENLTC